MYGVDIGEKWVYKRLLLRRHAQLDKAIPFLSGVLFFGQQLISNAGLRRILLFTTVQITLLFS